jgi:hypothetical protein
MSYPPDKDGKKGNDRDGGLGGTPLDIVDDGPEDDFLEEGSDRDLEDFLEDDPEGDGDFRDEGPEGDGDFQDSLPDGEIQVVDEDDFGKPRHGSKRGDGGFGELRHGSKRDEDGFGEPKSGSTRDDGGFGESGHGSKKDDGGLGEAGSGLGESGRGPDADTFDDGPGSGDVYPRLPEEEGGGGPEPLYLEDHGTFPVETRRLLARLLKGPYIDGRHQPELWTTLLKEESLVRRWLGEVFLDLVLDSDSRIAFTQQLDTFEYKVPILLRRHRLNFMESILVMFLRQRLTQSGLKGERAVVSGKDILAFLEFFNKQKQNDPSGFQRQVAAAMKKITDRYNLLRKISAAGDRYEISPALRLIIRPEDIAALKDVYRGIMGDAPLPEGFSGEYGEDGPVGGTGEASGGFSEEDGHITIPDGRAPGEGPGGLFQEAEEAFEREGGPPAPEEYEEEDEDDDDDDDY